MDTQIDYTRTAVLVVQGGQQMKSILDQDPLVNEVRRVRRELAKKCGYDTHKMYKELKKIENKNLGRVVKDVFVHSIKQARVA